MDLWLRWTPELLPAAARLLPRDDPAWEAADGTVFAQRSLLVATPHLLVATRCLEPGVVGRVVRSGEDALRVLTHLFPEDAADASGERLLVWFFRDRRDFLGYRDGELSPPEWSAGFYSPLDHASFFYPPDAEEEAVEEQDLAAVVAHELTHHFLGERHADAGVDPADLLRWLAEGFATFVEEQVVRPRAGGLPRLDDPLVLSLDESSSYLRMEGAEPIPLRDLLFMDGQRFATLGDAVLAGVPLSQRRGGVALTRRTLFYAESGALCFFLWNATGPEGRTRLLDVLVRAYRGGLPGDVDEMVRLLGFEDVPALEGAFFAFLRDPTGWLPEHRRADGAEGG